MDETNVERFRHINVGEVNKGKLKIQPNSDAIVTPVSVYLTI